MRGGLSVRAGEEASTSLHREEAEYLILPPPSDLLLKTHLLNQTRNSGLKESFDVGCTVSFTGPRAE